MSISYRKILNQVLLNFVKNVLNVIQKEGLGEEQLCYITFLVDYPGVELSQAVQNKYHHEITIVLQHQFENLQVYDDYFTVILRFNDIAETVKVPFVSITNLSDPSDNFYLSLTPPPVPTTKNINNKTIVNKLPASDEQDNKVISLEQFRNKNKLK